MTSRKNVFKRTFLTFAEKRLVITNAMRYKTAKQIANKIKVNVETVRDLIRRVNYELHTEY